MENINDRAEEVKNLIRSIVKNFRTYVADQIAEYNYTVPQLMVLQELYHHPDITLKELSELVGLAKSTVCGIVDRLEMHGAVIRVRNSEDRRNVKISLSSKVSELTDTANIIKKNYLAALLNKAEPAEVEQVIKGLRLLNSLAEDHKKGE